MKNKKIFVMLGLIIMIIGCTMSAAFAASCTCGKNKPHDSSHNKVYIVKDNKTHYIKCGSCLMNGHTELCEQVMLGEENHQWIVTQTGSTIHRVCESCQLEDEFVCNHSNATYNDTGRSTSATIDTCKKVCPDCKTVVETKKHNLTYSKIDTDNHEVTCKDCGFSKTTGHTFTNIYTPYKQPSNVMNKDIMVVPQRDHHSVRKCTGCGYSYVEKMNSEGNKVAHTFKNNVCTRCGLKSDVIKTKIKSLKGKKVGKVKVTTTYVSARWIWTGNKFIYCKPGTFKTYTYGLKLTWAKNKNAAGYYVSMKKPKEGSYMYTEFTEGTFTKKNSISLKPSSTKPAKKFVYYVAPVSKYGFVGKGTVVTVKVK